MNKQILFLVTLFFFFGCSTPVKHHQITDPAVFLNKKTFAWLAEDIPSEDVRVNNPTVRRLVMSSVEKELAGKGYSMTATQDADILITWFGHIDETLKEVRISSYYRSYGYAPLVGNRPENLEGDTTNQAYKKGTLIIDMIDPQSKTVFWRDTATDTILHRMNEKELAIYIDRSITAIIKAIPLATP